MNVRVNLNYPIYDGAEIVFRAPCDASEVTGLIVYYPGDAGEVSSVFTFADAHANDLGNIDALFAAGAVVKVIIDTDTNMAFVQNAATNAYLEEKFAGIGGGGTVDLSNYYTKEEVNQLAEKLVNDLPSLGLATTNYVDETLDTAIGDISTALDGIIAMQEYLMSGCMKTITFTVEYDNNVYTANEGMTWFDWVESEYNTTDFYIDGHNVCHEIGDALGLNGEAVEWIDSIIADAVYQRL